MQQKRWTTILFLATGAMLFANFFAFPSPSLAQTSPSQAQLEQELQDVEKQIQEFEKQLKETTTKKKTLANAIAQLKVRQKQLNALLRQTSLKIDSLNTTITAAERDLDATIGREARVREHIGTVIRMIHTEEVRPLFILAASKNLSSAFVEIQNYANMAEQLNDLVAEMRELKAQITKKKEQLEGQKEDAQDLLRVKTIQKQELLGTLKEQSTILDQTKGLEANYQTALQDSKRRAAEIRNRIYELFNTGARVNFGQAVEIAEWASKLTGVRPAYLLAILTQESNLGKNVGTCNRLGDPPEKSWREIMKPERDHEPFIEITTSLGLDTDTTPVSCPMRGKDGKRIGWGGAMGPAQFIPSTWMGYKDKVSALTGKTPANPWDIRDAFLAAAIKLRDGGAARGEEGEWRAAMVYFAGSVKLQYRFYGDNVMALTKKYQEDIDALN